MKHVGTGKNGMAQSVKMGLISTLLGHLGILYYIKSSSLIKE